MSVFITRRFLVFHYNKHEPKGALYDIAKDGQFDNLQGSQSFAKRLKADHNNVWYIFDCKLQAIVDKSEWLDSLTEFIKF